MKITRMTLLALSDAMQRGDLTSREVTQAYLDRIHPVSYTHLTLPTTPYV